MTPWLTTDEAAAYARCSATTIYRAIDAGALRASHNGPRSPYRIHTDWIDTWLERHAA